MKISQNEARRLKKRVVGLEELERRRRLHWSQQWIGGTEVASLQLVRDHEVAVAIRTTRLLKHAVVATEDGHGIVHFIALPHPKEDM